MTNNEIKNQIVASHLGVHKTIDNYRIEHLIEDLFVLLEIDLKETRSAE